MPRKQQSKKENVHRDKSLLIVQKIHLCIKSHIDINFENHNDEREACVDDIIFIGKKEPFFKRMGTYFCVRR